MSWDFEKILLVLMGVLILGGVGFIVWEDGRTAELEAVLPRMEKKLSEIGKRAEEIQVLESTLENDPVAKGVFAYEYLEQQMVRSRIGKSFLIDPGREIEEDGYKDVPWTMRPKSSAEDFDRQSIATFLLYVEGSTSRMRVSEIRLDVSNRRGAGPDDWKPVFQVTDRSATGTAGS